jgi:two-component system chemotaxis sensor kinase CheA
MNEAIDEIIRIQEATMNAELSHSRDLYRKSMLTAILALVSISIVAGIILIAIIRNITREVERVKNVMANAVACRTSQMPRITEIFKDELGEIALAYNEMAATIEQQVQQEKEHSWLNAQVAETMALLQGTMDLPALAQKFLAKIAPVVGATYSVFYLKEGEGEQARLVKLAGYAAKSQDIGALSFRLGEGLVGQCAVDNKPLLLTQVPDNYIRIESGLGEAVPKTVILLPITFEGNVEAVIEIAALASFTKLQRTLLTEVTDSVGVVLNNNLSYVRVQRLLKESQVLTEELQAQSEELQNQSEELQAQQEELRNINEKLEDQYRHSEEKAKELAKTKAVLEKSLKELAMASKYKSEFLTNISHEIRTPLNSMLILTQVLAQNNDGNLTAKQVEYANTIYSSGNDLLVLLSDILDLSKVESGKMEIHPSSTVFSDIVDFMDDQFNPVAAQKGLHFSVELAPNLPKSILTDEQRLQQILKNLLANAFKFTERGSVRLKIYKATEQKIDLKISDGQSVIAFAVTDTGIGIPVDKQQIIFDAFQQADGTTSRRYGGSGLGLSICREFAKILGGCITVQSTQGQGSIFTLYLPDSSGYAADAAATAVEQVAAGQAEFTFNSVQIKMQTLDVPKTTQFQGKKILIADDDMRNVFALTTVLEGYQIQVFVAENGQEAIDILKNNSDIDLVLMDIMMPEMDGYEATRFIRQNLKRQDLPIIALTAKAMKYDRDKCIEAGATDYISKPINLDQLLSIIHVWLYKTSGGSQ